TSVTPTPFGGTGAGTLEWQDPTALSLPSGAYAFVTRGTDSGRVVNSKPQATAIGGVLNIDNNPSTGDISGNGSLADQDYYTSGTRTFLSCLPPDGVTGNVTWDQQSLGVVTISLTGST